MTQNRPVRAPEIAQDALAGPGAGDGAKRGRRALSGPDIDDPCTCGCCGLLWPSVAAFDEHRKDMR